MSELICEFHFGSFDFVVSLGHPVVNLDLEFRKKFNIGDLCLEVFQEGALKLYTFLSLIKKAVVSSS